MSIPESKLKTWSHQGSITQSSNTYNTIKNVLEVYNTPYRSKDFKVFLQGSYGNDTNIYAESDVDIVIQLNDCFNGDLSNLSEADKAAYKDCFSKATYTYSNFKDDVLSVLKDKYGNAVKTGNKAITIDANSSRRKSDVIVAIQHRRYFKFRSSSNSSYIAGMCFYNTSNQPIANFPKDHSANLTDKHQASSNKLKPLIRVFKNMRNCLIDERLINAGIAPSYYIEGLLYNVPNENFTSSFQDSVVNILNWFYYLKKSEKEELLCANERYYLLRDGSNTSWSPVNCTAFINAAFKLWDEW